MSKERVSQLLANLGRYLPGYNHRPGQVEMAQAVAGAIEDRHNLVVEGGTGIGKSMAYLVPGLLSVVEDGARILVATSHKPLQDQIARKDLPLLARLFRDEGYKPFKWTTLKGVSNYLCWNSADALKERMLVDPLAAEAITYASLAGQDFSGDFEEFPFNLTPEARALVSASSEDCLANRCPHRDRCFALKVRQQAEQADIVVTNHALLSLDIKAEGNIIPGKFATYIIDEGHNFEENATQAHGLQVTLGGLRRFVSSEAVRQAAVTSSQRLLNARDDIDRLQTEIAGLFALAQPDNRYGSPPQVQGQFSDEENKVIIRRELLAGKQLVETLKPLVALVKSFVPRTEEEAARFQRVHQQGQALVERLERISANADANLVYYAERANLTRSENGRPEPVIKVMGRTLPGPAAYSLYAMPVDVSGYLQRWFRDNQVVVTSATMSDGQNFDFFIKRLGLEKPATLIVPSPFNYREQVRLFLPRSFVAAQGAGQSRQLAERMVELLNLTPGRALMLFTSHGMLEGVWRQLSGSLREQLDPARPLFKQGQAQMQRIIAEFQATESGVVLGTRSWWQGVDLPGMRLLVIDKLPFPQLNDPIIRARIEDIEEAGRSSFQEFMLPLAIITFRQGFGRLMRQESDWGVVVVCDERIVQKSYGWRFRKSLPELSVLPNLDSLKDFMQAQTQAQTGRQSQV